MIEEKVETAIKGFCEAKSNLLCPLCMGSMLESDRIKENGFLFIWHECEEDDCDGQWFEKKSVSP